MLARRLAPALAGLLVLVPAWTGAAAPPDAPAQASACRVLRVGTALRRTLKRVHVASLEAAGGEVRVTGGPRGTRYGRCGRTYYALATFTHATDETDFGPQDQPERFSRRVGGRWRDRGDTGGDVCGAAPPALIELWGYDECSSGSSSAARR